MSRLTLAHEIVEDRWTLQDQHNLCASGTSASAVFNGKDRLLYEFGIRILPPSTMAANDNNDEPDTKCLYHRTVYALRENSSSVKCERHPSRVMECAVPLNGNARPPYNVGNKIIPLDLCYKHYRVVDYIRGAEGARTPKKRRQKNTL